MLKNPNDENMIWIFEFLDFQIYAEKWFSTELQKKTNKTVLHWSFVGMDRRNLLDKSNTWKYATTAATGALLGIGCYLATRWKVALPHQKLVSSGLLIKGLKVSDKTFLLPGQVLIRVPMNPCMSFFLFSCLFSRFITLNIHKCFL